MIVRIRVLMRFVLFGASFSSLYYCFEELVLSSGWVYFVFRVFVFGGFWYCGE